MLKSVYIAITIAVLSINYVILAPAPNQTVSNSTTARIAIDTSTTSNRLTDFLFGTLTNLVRAFSPVLQSLPISFPNMIEHLN